jgi:transposase-like protein
MPGFAWRREKSQLMAHARKYSKELLDRGTRLVFESGRPVAHVAKDLGIESETCANTSGRPKLTRAGAKMS